jgi:competence protein ComEC
MSVLKRLLPYIILNILVSAATTWAVLTWWTNTHPATPTPNLPLPTQAAPATTAAQGTAGSQPTALASSTPQPAGTRLVEIAEVTGIGSLGTEMVLLRRVGEGEVRLNGWRLDDNAGHRFALPDIVLNKGGAVRIYTRSGTNTVNELYWGLKEAVWASGKTIALYDEQGTTRAVFIIP